MDDACGGDLELKDHVLKLLSAHSQSSGFMDWVSDETNDHSNSDLPRETIGPYKLREKIGEGGFGTVFVAEQQQPVKRKVALKIIKPGMESKEIIARFEAERQALAMMDHPNVAKVLDAGSTEDGRPYFVMELVQGTSITEFCDQQKLTNRKRLELFIDVCSAVQHAHQKGIIHRDLKPTNVMVTTSGDRMIPKVIDFGVAKALHHDLTEKSIYTAYGQLIGTPMYMSPEQAELSSLDVDTRSDIYSLGVLLYELLTGATPFDKETFKRAGFDEVRRMIREDEPRRPSDRVSSLRAELQSTVSEKRNVDQRILSRSLRGDLDWIVMKALDKDRSRRYETANGMAADVQRYLNNEPIVACPPSTTYRMRKFVSRNKGVLIAGSMIAASLIVGTALSVWQAIVANSESIRARDAEHRAEQNFEIAWDTVDTTLDRVADKLKNVPHLQSLRRELLDQALGFYGEFLNQKSNDPEVRYRCARSHYRTGYIYQMLGELEKGKEQYGKAIRRYQELTGDYPNDLRFLRGLGEVHHSLAVSKRKNDPQGALDSIQKSISVMEKLVAKLPRESEECIDLANSYSFLAQRRIDSKDFVQAAKECQKGLDVITIEAEQNHKAAALSVRGLLVHVKGRIANRQQQKEVAQRHFEDSIELFKQSLEINPGDRLTRHVLGNAYSNLSSVVPTFEEMEMARGKQLAICRLLVDDFPSVPRYKLDLANVLRDWAYLLKRKHREQEAERHGREAIDWLTKTMEDYPGDPGIRYALATAYQDLAFFCSDNEAKSEAREKKLSICRSLVADFPSNIQFKAEFVDALKDWANVLAGQERQQDAENLFREAIVLADDLSANFPTELEHRRLSARTRTQFCEMLVAQKRFAETIEFMEDAIPVWITVAEENPDDMTPFRNLVICQKLIANSVAASASAPESNKTIRELADYMIDRAIRSKATAVELNHIAWSLLGVDFPWPSDPKLAVEFAIRACRVAENAGYASLPNYLDTLAMAQHKTGDNQAAIETQTRALSLVIEKMDDSVADELQEHMQLFRSAAGDSEKIIQEY